MKKIKQIVIFDASPEEVYNAILNPEKHSMFTGEKATNSMKVGGKFTAYAGYSYGINLVLEKNKKIVQKWTTTDLPEDYFTMITFEFRKQGSKTKMIFTQTNVPNERYKDIFDGWEEYYWKPLKEFLKK